MWESACGARVLRVSVPWKLRREIDALRVYARGPLGLWAGPDRANHGRVKNGLGRAGRAVRSGYRVRVVTVCVQCARVPSQSSASHCVTVAERVGARSGEERERERGEWSGVRCRARTSNASVRDDTGDGGRGKTNGGARRDLSRAAETFEHTAIFQTLCQRKSLANKC